MSEPSLILRCAGRSFALPLPSVVEVTRMVAPALLLPRAPRYCLGVVDYHGQLVPLIDLAARLGQAAVRPLGEFLNGRLVFVQTQSGLFGFAVDEVPELSDRPVEPLTTTAQALNAPLQGLVRWREHEVAPLLLIDAVLSIAAGTRLQKLLAEALAASAPDDCAVAGSPAAGAARGAGAEA